MTVLVVCRNEANIQTVRSAFKLEADYKVFGDGKGGARYDKIIVFCPFKFDQQKVTDYFNYLRLALPPGREKEFYVL